MLNIPDLGMKQKTQSPYAAPQYHCRRVRHQSFFEFLHFNPIVISILSPSPKKKKKVSSKPSPAKEDSGKYKSAEFVDTDDSSSEDEKPEKKLKRSKKEVNEVYKFYNSTILPLSYTAFSPFLLIYITSPVYLFVSCRQPRNPLQVKNPKKQKVNPKSLKMNQCLNECGVSFTVWIVQVCIYKRVIDTVGFKHIYSSTRILMPEATICCSCKYFISLLCKKCYALIEKRRANQKDHEI